MTEIYLLLGIFALIFNYATDQICNLNQLRQADDIKLVFCSYYEWFDSCLLFYFFPSKVSLAFIGRKAHIIQ